MDCQHSCKSNLANTMRGVSGLEEPTSLVAATMEKMEFLKERMMVNSRGSLPFEYVLRGLWLLSSRR